MIRGILIDLGLVYDPNIFALKRSQALPEQKVKPKEVIANVNHTPTLGVPNRLNVIETDPEAGVISYEVLSKKEALSGHDVQLSAAELTAIEDQRKKTRFKLLPEHCLEVKRGLAKGLSLTQIASLNKGIKGLSLRAVKAISTAINSCK